MHVNESGVGTRKNAGPVRAALVAELGPTARVVGGAGLGVLTLAGLAAFAAAPFGALPGLAATAGGLATGLVIAALIVPGRLRALSLEGPSVVVDQGVLHVPGFGDLRLEDVEVEGLGIEHPYVPGSRVPLPNGALLVVTRRSESSACLLLGATWNAPPSWPRDAARVKQLADSGVPAFDVVAEHFGALARALVRRSPSA